MFWRSGRHEENQEKFPQNAPECNRIYQKRMYHNQDVPQPFLTHQFQWNLSQLIFERSTNFRCEIYAHLNWSHRSKVEVNFAAASEQACKGPRSICPFLTAAFWDTKWEIPFEKSFACFDGLFLLSYFSFNSLKLVMKIVLHIRSNEDQYLILTALTTQKIKDNKYQRKIPSISIINKISITNRDCMSVMYRFCNGTYLRSIFLSTS